MDGMTFFLILLLGMTVPIIAIVAAVLFDMAVVAVMGIISAYRGITDWGHGVRVHWARAAHR